MKLLIAIPTLDYIHHAFMQSLVKLVTRLKDDGVDFDVEIKSGTLVYHARNLLATKARQEGYTHVLWLDSDMVFTEDLLDDLMFSGKDFVSGIYHARREPHVSCIFKGIDPVDRFSNDTYPTEPFEIRGCGFGCVLMTVDVINKVFSKFDTCFLPMASYGEDLAFCFRATCCGIKIYCDPGVRLGHVGHITIYPEYEEKWKAKELIK